MRRFIRYALLYVFGAAIVRAIEFAERRRGW